MVAVGAVLLDELPPPPLHAAISAPAAPASIIRDIVVNMELSFKLTRMSFEFINSCRLAASSMLPPTSGYAKG
jgi:hypothetical protein